MYAGPAQAPPPHPPLRARSLRSLRAQPQPRVQVQYLSVKSGESVRDPSEFIRARRGVRAHERSGVHMEIEDNYTCDICGESFDRDVDIAGHTRAHQMSIPVETIIDELQRIADRKGRPPKESELREEAEFTEGAVSSTFGSWSEGLESAGLKTPNKRVYRYRSHRGATTSHNTDWPFSFTQRVARTRRDLRANCPCSFWIVE